MKDLEAAWSAIDTFARQNCDACYLEKTGGKEEGHTCDEFRRLAANGMKAAALAGWNAPHDSAYAELQAAIDKLLAAKGAAMDGD
jgi:hypothetical protein